jgi:type IX secretion system PorP/SprF family membrane protein
MYKLLIIWLIILSTSLQGFGQVPPFSDQFLVNSFLTNPALAGTSRLAPLTVSVRQQWMGLTTAPLYQAISYHKSMMEKGQRYNPRGLLNRGENSFGKIGIGGGLFNMNYGAVNQLGIHLDYGYHVFLNNGRLSFGLAVLYQRFAIKTDNFIRPDGTLPDEFLDNLAELNGTVNIFDATVGTHYQSNFFFAGGSVINLFNSSVRFKSDLMFDQDGTKYTNRFLSRTAYLYGGISPSIGKYLAIKPSVLVKFNTPEGFSFQGNAIISFSEKVETGALFRYAINSREESIGLFLGIKALNVLIRYQFEYPIGTALGPNRITNQILLGYLL